MDKHEVSKVQEFRHLDYHRDVCADLETDADAVFYCFCLLWTYFDIYEKDFYIIDSLYFNQNIKDFFAHVSCYNCGK